MKLSKPTIQELGIILKEEFKVDLASTDLEKFAYSLVGYFGLLFKAKARGSEKVKFGNRSASRIDNEFQKGEDKKTQK